MKTTFTLDLRSRAVGLNSRHTDCVVRWAKECYERANRFRRIADDADRGILDRCNAREEAKRYTDAADGVLNLLRAVADSLPKADALRIPAVRWALTHRPYNGTPIEKEDA